MTSFDFAYYRPDTLTEAIQCYQALAAENKNAVYYGGGTEIISMARAESLRFDAVIDLKGIPECNVLSTEGENVVLGGMLTLTSIAESGCFPLLGETVARIADHTIQGKITLAGNLGGTIIYRESALPLMITGCRAKIMTAGGLEERSFAEIFDGRMRLAAGEFLAQLLIDKNDINLPYNHVKRTRTDKIDYPLITLVANKKDSSIRAAVSGAASSPLALPAETLNNLSMSGDERVSAIIASINGRMLADIHGGKEYRTFVLRDILSRMYSNF